jgi:hypothetical protein
VADPASSISSNSSSGGGGLWGVADHASRDVAASGGVYGLGLAVSSTRCLLVGFRDLLLKRCFARLLMVGRRDGLRPSWRFRNWARTLLDRIAGGVAAHALTAFSYWLADRYVSFDEIIS